MVNPEPATVLILIAAFEKNTVVAVIASLGVILGAAYMLWLYRRIIFGRILINEIKGMKDLNKTESYIFGSLVFLTILFGIYPEPLLNTLDVSIINLINNYQNDINFYVSEINK